MQDIKIKDPEYAILQKILFKETGIALGPNKQSMVKARLLKRLHHHGVTSYADYLKIVQISEIERVHFLNQLSTNETYFFREKDHFKFLKTLINSQSICSIRVWSAAASQGAEAYSIAMVLESINNLISYEVVGTDINTDVLELATRALYPFCWIERIPSDFQKKYCLKGEGQYEGKFLIDPLVQQKVQFFPNNLLYANESLGEFTIIFLRNVLLYFNEETKIRVIQNILKNLKKDGFLIISMTETFDMTQVSNLKYINNSIYQKVTNR